MPTRLLAVLLPLALPGPAEPAHWAKAAGSVVLIRAETSPLILQQGSGVVLGPGLVATNAHVVRNAQTIWISKDGRSWAASELCVAADRDLALLRVPGLTLPAVTAAAEAPTAEQPVIALGYPGGRGPTLERGRVSSLWKYRGDLLIQADARTQPGSSGGGLFNEQGELLGITTFVFSGSRRFNFSVPVRWIQALVAAPNAGLLQCPAVVTDHLLRSSAELLAEDSANQGNWELFTRTWTQDSPEDADAWCALGEALDGRREDAVSPAPQGSAPDGATLAAFRRAVTLNPGHARAWNNLGVDLDNQNRFQEAKDAFHRAVAIEPGYGIAWLNLGNTLMNASDLPGAIAAYTQGLRLLPDRGQSWARLGYCEARLQRWSAAAAHYRLALGFQPFRVEWWGERFQACTQAGAAQEAEDCLNRLRSMSPELAEDMERWRKQTGRKG